MINTGAAASLQHQPTNLPLLNLYCRRGSAGASPYISGGLAAAIQFCPFVVNVDISSFDGVFDEELQALREMKNLRHLTLRFLNISFDGGLLPILEKFGPHSLKELELKNVTEVDVAAIAQNCPKLRSLKLIRIGRYIRSTPQQSQSALQQLIRLQHLEIDHIFPNSMGAPMSTDISILFSSPSLVSISIYGLNTVTDHVIEQAVLCHHSFRKLSSLLLTDCPNITARSIDLLLSLLYSPLKKIDLIRCNNVWSMDVDKLEKTTIKNNWDLSITQQR